MADKHSTLFGPSEDGYEPPADPEPGDEVWQKLKWIIYPLIVVAIFSHGAFSNLLNKVFFALFVMGLLITNEGSELGDSRTCLCLVIAGFAHLCLMSLCYNFLPEHRRLLAIVFVSAGESFYLNCQSSISVLGKSGMIHAVPYDEPIQVASIVRKAGVSTLNPCLAL